ncbi:glycosyltransferase family 39 protein [Candidatus Woesebacteria bacterium]|nr:glycosyltransferase family 39 protein [Candidatus Woesebacteria bacterium]
MSVSHMLHSKRTISLLCSIIVVVAAVLFFNRAIIFTTPDWHHLEDYFAHSQWAIPFSTRTISDNQLYSVAALKLARGVHPFLINPEVPPLGKYLYSFSIWLTGNPFYTSLILYCGVLVLTGLIAYTYTKRNASALFGVLLVALSPAVSAQVGVTMLDLPLTFFLLLHIWMLIQLVKTKTNNKRLLYTLWAGIALGGFAATKFPLFVPLVLLPDLWFFWHERKLRAFAVMICAATLTFMLSYLAYFLQGNTLIEWARSLYWTIQFYTNGAQTQAFFQIFPAVLFGHYKNGVTAGALGISEWNILWPVLLAGIPLGFIALIRQKMTHSSQKLLLLLITLYLTALCFVQFQARYFFPLIPLLIILLVAHFRVRQSLVIIFLGILGIQNLLYWRSIPTELVRESERMWTHGHYQDLYSFVSPDSAQVDRQTFHSILTKQILQNLSVQQQHIEIHFPPVSWFDQITHSEATGMVTIRLKTEFGEVERMRPIRFVRTANQWLLQWDWQLYLDNFSPQCTTGYTIDNEKGKLLTSDGVTVSEFTPTAYARLNTQAIPTTIETFENFAQLVGIEDLQAESSIQNTANGRDWLDLPLPLSKATDSTNTLYSRITSREKLVRTYNSLLTPAQKSSIEKFELEHQELFEAATTTIRLICPEQGYTQTIPGSRIDVKLPYTFKKIPSDS